MKTYDITSGSYQLDPLGRPKKVTDGDAVRQLIYTRLKTKRGSFVYDQNLGSRLYELGKARRSERETLAKVYVEEALKPELDAGTIEEIQEVTVSYPDQAICVIYVLCLLPSGEVIAVESVVN